MVNLFKWFSKELAIDLGTANTLIYVPDKGIVVDEPSYVAADVRTKKIVAIGHEAKKMYGMVPEEIKVVRPLKDGVIADFTMTTEMLKHFIKQAIKHTRFLRPKVVIAVPSGITEVEKKAVRDAALQVGANKVTMILEPMAAAIGAQLPVLKPTGNMVVDIGGGTTDVAVITLAGIATGHSLRIAGDKMDEVIIRYIRHKYNLLIGLKTAEMLKKTIGSAYPLQAERFAEVRGRNLALGVPGMAKVSSEEIREALVEPLFAIVETVRQTLEDTPPEIGVDIMEHGIVLTGGGALLKNLDYKIKEETGLPVSRIDDSLTSVVLGAGMALVNRKLLKTIAVG
ncbi:rod shape-determining protein [candidate division KSB3 bacterium]|uniref:Cell shape-determining protein MreB n=1 Tax=candidate division KSB3 bacterium TaxID=2044937 RepID=A0A2G6KJS2_9BACT|nr:MAG: rod shape-determining protein [candidate division KSB3 bacterium]